MSMASLNLGPVKALILKSAIDFYESGEFSEWVSPKHGRFRSLVLTVTAGLVLYWLIKSSFKAPAEKYWM